MGFCLTLHHTTSIFDDPKKKKDLCIYTVGRGENAGNHFFPPFSCNFFKVLERNFTLVVTSNLSSVNALNSD